MDEAGWHARRAAAKDAERYARPVRNQDGSFTAVEPEPQPLGDPQQWPTHRIHARGPPPVPPKDKPRPSQISTRVPRISTDTRQTSSSQMPLTAVERSRLHPPPPRMEPHLQFMAGPMLRFDTIEHGDTWLGACMIVTADAGSVYEPAPFLTLDWDPDKRPDNQRSPHSEDYGSANGTERTNHLAEAGLAPHPADIFPSAISPTPSQLMNVPIEGPKKQSLKVSGQEIWFYQGRAASFTFWRFMLRIPLGKHDMVVQYHVNNGLPLEFHVPARGQNMRVAAYSCNGFSSGVNPDDFRGPGFTSGYDPVWMDLLEQHSANPFHVLVGGGDQLYCDSIVREPELQPWVLEKDIALKKNVKLSDEVQHAIDRFYFSHYCTSFRTGAFARANSTIPMLNMLDDHDLIDGFGSYPEELQTASIFKHIGSRGYFFFLLFQCFIVADIDGINPAPGSHLFKSTVIGGMGPYVPFPSHSVLSQLGPNLAMLLLDCRAERRREQVCSSEEYDRVFRAVLALPETVDHLVVQLGIPIAYPRMNFLESALSSRLNPLIALSRSGTFAKSMVNKFNADAELLDDLNDHWTAKGHKSERNWFIEQMQTVALSKRMRITFLSGDVHCAAVGQFKTLTRGKSPEVLPGKDHRWMINVVSSAIVNTPPPNAVLTMVSMLSGKTHKTMHHVETDEKMVPVFTKDTTGASPKSRFIMGKRNYSIIERDSASGDLACEIRVEIEKGVGKTVGYPIRAPPPLWTASKLPEM